MLKEEGNLVFILLQLLNELVADRGGTMNEGVSVVDEFGGSAGVDHSAPEYSQYRLDDLK